MSRGFSTIELLIAFAIAMLVIVAVVQVMFGAQYWLIASQTSSEGLYKAKTMLEDLRSAAEKDFQLASSTELLPDTLNSECIGGELCYYKSATISDISQCSKLAHAHVEWRVPGYGTTTSDLYTNLTSPNEIVKLGSDCSVNAPVGDWTGMSSDSLGGVSGTAHALDAQDGIAFVATSAGLSAEGPSDSGFVAVASGFNGLDVARDAVTGRTYAYMAGASSADQLKIYEVTDPSAPVFVSQASLPGTAEQATSTTFYGRMVYVWTREGSGNDFYVFDVADPTNPVFRGSIELNTSVYGVHIRDQLIGGTVRRLAFLATSNTSREVRVLDVTDPTAMTTLAEANLPTSKPALSIFVAGSRIYVGLESGSEEELFVLDGSEEMLLSGTLPVLSATETSPRSVTTLRVSSDMLFMVGINASSRIEVRDAHSPDTLIGTESITGIAPSGFDLEDDTVYSVTAGGAVRAHTSL